MGNIKINKIKNMCLYIYVASVFVWVWSTRWWRLIQLLLIQDLNILFSRETSQAADELTWHEVQHHAKLWPCHLMPPRPGPPKPDVWRSPTSHFYRTHWATLWEQMRSEKPEVSNGWMTACFIIAAEGFGTTVSGPKITLLANTN